MEFKLYPWRWAVLSCFCVINLLQCIAQVTLSAFTTQCIEAFDVSATVATLANDAGMAVFLPCFLCATYLYNEWTLWGVSLISALLTFFGGWIRTLSMLPSQKFIWIVVG